MREDGAALAQAFHFPLGLPNRLEGDVGLEAVAVRRGERYSVTLQTRKFAQSVHVEMPGYLADDQYFHMAPKTTRVIELRPRQADPAAAGRPRPPHGLVYALNAAWPVSIAFQVPAEP